MAFEPATGTASASRSARAWALVEICRPRQWAKNLLVLAPLVFASLFTNAAMVAQALSAAGLFCLASAATYVWNDLNDVEADRAHPVKRHTRPLAAGRMSPRAARVELAVLLGLVAAGALVQPWVGLVVAVYLAVNAMYSTWAKSVPLADLAAVSAGFVLRVAAGALAIQVPLSPWMVVATLCLALFLAADKRASEAGSCGARARSVLSSYSARDLAVARQLAAVGALVTYGFYTVQVRPQLAVTVPLVLLGFLRFAHVSDGENPSGPIERASADPPLVITVAVWVAATLVLLAP